MAKTWDDVYIAAVQRGLDHGYAAFLADEWKKRQIKVIHLVPTDGSFTACGRKPKDHWRVTTAETKTTCRQCLRCMGARERRMTAKP